jgi:hypothetical protein
MKGQNFVGLYVNLKQVKCKCPFIQMYPSVSFGTISYLYVMLHSWKTIL